MSARADLCGGRSAMIVPSATSLRQAGLETCIGLLSPFQNSG
jgi:predicted TIM-barrel enzyme